MKRLIRWMLALLLLAAAFGAGVAYRSWSAAQAKKAGGRKILYWQDPMHPWYRSDRPGVAPDCGMKLEPVYEGAAPARPERPVLYYRDPKDHKYISKTPGINPETGTDLEPVYAEGPAAGTIDVSSEVQQRMGLRFTTAELTAGVPPMRATGRIVIDERRVQRVHSKVEGWIERVFADFTGQPVIQGQPLFTVYSPEMLASQEEFLLALKSKNVLASSSLEGVQANADRLVQAARRRLALWDLSEEQIREIERSGRPVKTITIHAPYSGYLLERNAYPNQKITPETELYTIADLSRVWVMAEIFESDASAVRVGSMARIRISAQPGRVITAPVTYVQPQFDAATRTMKVRLEVPNPGLRLRPEMFVEVEIRPADVRRLTVPAESVLDSGSSKIVFADRGGGQLEPVRVETGAHIGDRIEILRGLKPGERIAAAGAFLLNSESQLKTAAGAAHDQSSH